MNIIKLQKKHFAKKCKNKSCRDALQPKNTSPKTNETSDNAHRNACADYPHITSQCIYRVATIPTSFQPHPPQSCICEMGIVVVKFVGRSMWVCLVKCSLVLSTLFSMLYGG